MICENANIGKSGLCRKFKSAVGTSVFKYIEFSRISLAKDLLVDTDESISNIAQKSGFESFAYFEHLLVQSSAPNFAISVISAFSRLNTCSLCATEVEL